MTTVAEIIVRVRTDTSRVDGEAKASGASSGKSFAQAFKVASYDAEKALKASMKSASEAARADALSAAKAAGKSMEDAFKDMETAGKLASKKAFEDFDDEASRASHRMAQAQGEANRSSLQGQMRAQREAQRVQQDESAKAGKRSGKTFGAGIVGGVKGLAGPLAVAFAGLKIGSLLKDSISSAGSLEQSIGAIDTVFKGSADQIHSWSKEAAQSVGLARNEYNELGTLIGTQLKNGGLAMDQLAPKTNGLIKMGADLSSMFGGSTKEAVEALSSALKGERDPIERYGVSITEATLKAEAMAKGIIKPVKDMAKVNSIRAEMTATQKAYNEALKGEAGAVTAADKLKVEAASKRVAIAQANYAKALKDSGKNSKAALSASAALDSAQASYNTTLDSYKKKMAGTGPDEEKAAKLKAKLAEQEGKLSKAMAGSTSEMTAQQKQQATLSLIAKQSADAQGNFAKESDTLQGQQQRLAAQWDNLKTELGMKLLPVVTKLVTFLNKNLGPAMKWLSVNVLPPLKAAFSAIATAMDRFFGKSDKGTSKFSEAMDRVRAVLEPLIPRVRAILAGLVKGVQEAFALVALVVKRVSQAINWLWTNYGEELTAIIRYYYGLVFTIIETVLTYIRDLIAVWTAIFNGEWSKAGSLWGKMMKNAFKGIYNIILSYLKLVLKVAELFLKLIGRAFAALGTALKNAAVNAMNKFLAAFSAGLGVVGRWFAALPGNIVKAFTGLGLAMFDIGKNLMQGLLNGIVSLGQKVVDAVTNPLKAAVNGAKKVLDQHSPSRVFKKIGVFTMQGYIDGVDAKSGAAVSAVTGTMRSVVNAGNQLASQSSIAVPSSMPGQASVAGTTSVTYKAEIKVEEEVKVDKLKRLFHEMQLAHELSLA